MHVEEVTEMSRLTCRDVVIDGQQGARVTRSRDHEPFERSPMERKHVTFRPDFVREKRRCIPDVRLIFVVQEQIDVRCPVWPVYDDVALSGKELPVT